MGRGFPLANTTKQKLNTRSSTESELVAVDDCMPSICWTRYFMLSQGYEIAENILYQDNRSAILLEKNGKASSSKRTKHINIRFFFVTDRVANDELSVRWCPTGAMIADFWTKPLQGALFKKFRDQIMGVIKAESPDVSDAGQQSHGQQQSFVFEIGYEQNCRRWYKISVGFYGEIEIQGNWQGKNAGHHGCAESRGRGTTGVCWRNSKFLPKPVTHARTVLTPSTGCMGSRTIQTENHDSLTSMG